MLFLIAGNSSIVSLILIYANIDEEGVLPMEFYSFTWNIVHLLSVLFPYTDNNLVIDLFGGLTDRFFI